MGVEVDYYYYYYSNAQTVDAAVVVAAADGGGGDGRQRPNCFLHFRVVDSNVKEGGHYWKMAGDPPARWPSNWMEESDFPPCLFFDRADERLFHLSRIILMDGLVIDKQFD